MRRRTRLACGMRPARRVDGRAFRYASTPTRPHRPVARHGALCASSMAIPPRMWALVVDWRARRLVRDAGPYPAPPLDGGRCVARRLRVARRGWACRDRSARHETLSARLEISVRSCQTLVHSAKLGRDYHRDYSDYIQPRSTRVLFANSPRDVGSQRNRCRRIERKLITFLANAKKKVSDGDGRRPHFSPVAVLPVRLTRAPTNYDAARKAVQCTVTLTAHRRPEPRTSPLFKLPARIH